MIGTSASVTSDLDVIKAMLDKAKVVYTLDEGTFASLLLYVDHVPLFMFNQDGALEKVLPFD